MTDHTREALAELTAEVGRHADEYRIYYPAPYSLPPNLTLATRACALASEVQAERDAALAQLGAIAALADEADSVPSGLLHVDRLRAILADPAGAIAKREQQVRAAWAAEVCSAMERLIDLRSDYLPGLTGAQMPHLDLIQQEIATVQLVLRILRTGDARGWAHSSRWNELDGLDVLARAEALTEGRER